MKVGRKHYRSIWLDDDSGTVKIIDQRWLPHELRIVELANREAFATSSAICGSGAHR